VLTPNIFGSMSLTPFGAYALFFTNLPFGGYTQHSNNNNNNNNNNKLL